MAALWQAAFGSADAGQAKAFLHMTAPQVSCALQVWREHAMNDQHRAIRAILSAMAPRRAVACIQAFELPEDEERCLIECDVRRKSYAQVSELLHISPETVKRRRHRAYQKISDIIIQK